MAPCAGLFLAAALAGCAGAPASQMPLAGPTAAPVGATLFCARNPAECAPAPSTETRIAMTDARWAELRRVQHAVNAALEPMAADGVAWHYADGNRGGCVQYALEKRRTLIHAGWPPGALQLATVVTSDDVGHLVLVVATTEGDWVLDNLRRDVVAWDSLPYRWVERQQSGSMWSWVRVGAAGGAGSNT